MKVLDFYNSSDVILGSYTSLHDIYPHLKLISKIPKTSGLLGVFVPDEYKDVEGIYDTSRNRFIIPDVPTAGEFIVCNMNGSVERCALSEDDGQPYEDVKETMFQSIETKELKQILEALPVEERLQYRFNQQNAPEVLNKRNEFVEQFWSLPEEQRDFALMERIYNINKQNLQETEEELQKILSVSVTSKKEEEMNFQQIIPYIPEDVKSELQVGLVKNTAAKLASRISRALPASHAIPVKDVLPMLTKLTKADIEALNAFSPAGADNTVDPDPTDEDNTVNQEVVEDTVDPAEEARKAEEAIKAEATRKAEIARVAEETRKAALAAKNKQFMGGNKMNKNEMIVDPKAKINQMKEFVTTLEVTGTDGEAKRLAQDIKNLSVLSLFVVDTDSRLTASAPIKNKLQPDGSPIFKSGYDKEKLENMKKWKAAETVKQPGWPVAQGNSLKRVKAADIYEQERVLGHKLSKPSRPLAAIIKFPIAVGNLNKDDAGSIADFYENQDGENVIQETATFVMPLSKIFTLLSTFMTEPEIKEDPRFDNSMAKGSKDKHYANEYYRIEIIENEFNSGKYKDDKEKLDKAKKRFKAWRLVLSHTKRSSVLTANNYVALRKAETSAINLLTEDERKLVAKGLYGKVTGEIVQNSKDGAPKEVPYTTLREEDKLLLVRNTVDATTEAAFLDAENPVQIIAKHWGRYTKEDKAVEEEQYLVPMFVQGKASAPSVKYKTLEAGDISIENVMFSVIDESGMASLMPFSNIPEMENITEADLISAKESQLADEKKNNASSKGSVEAAKVSNAILEISKNKQFSSNVAGTVASVSETMKQLEQLRMMNNR